MNAVKADRRCPRHRAVNVVYQTLDQIVEMKNFDRNIFDLFEMGFIATMVRDEHQFRSVAVVTIEQLFISRSKFLLYSFLKIRAASFPIFESLPEVFHLLIKRWGRDLIELFGELRIKNVMQNCLTVMCCEEGVNLSIL